MSRMSIDYDELRRKQGKKGAGKPAVPQGKTPSLGVYGSQPPTPAGGSAPPTNKPADGPLPTSTLADRPQKPNLATSSIALSDQDRRNRLIDIERRRSQLRMTPNSEFRTDPSLAGEARGLRYEGRDLLSSLREPGPTMDPAQLAKNQTSLNEQAVANLQAQANRAANAVGPRSIGQVEDRAAAMLPVGRRPMERPMNQPGNITPGELAFERGQAVRNYGTMSPAIDEELGRREGARGELAGLQERLRSARTEGIPFAPAPTDDEQAATRERMLTRKDDARARTDPALLERVRQREFAPEMAEAQRGEALSGVGREGRLAEAGIRGVEAGATEAEARAKLLEAQSRGETARANREANRLEQSPVLPEPLPEEEVRGALQSRSDAFALAGLSSEESVQSFYTGTTNAVAGIRAGTSGSGDVKDAMRGFEYLTSVTIPTLSRIAEHDRNAAAIEAGKIIEQLGVGVGGDRWRMKHGTIRSPALGPALDRVIAALNEFAGVE